MYATTYIARWYVNGIADIALVSEYDDELAREVVKHHLEQVGIKPDRGYEKISLRPCSDRHMSFLLLSHGGRV